MADYTKSNFVLMSNIYQKGGSMRKLGSVLLELEPILDEMCDHELQMGDILALVKSYLEVHRPDCIEECVDGTVPVFFYGPKKD